MPVKGRLFRIRYLLGLAMLIGGASLAQPVANSHLPALSPGGPFRSDISVLTYNVKGLPWPIASNRETALAEIGARLAALRAEGRQPTIVVLQEAFTREAKAIGERAGYPYRIDGPYLREDAEHPVAGRAWYRGETQKPALDSGLVVLSDVPLTDIARAAFPSTDCAGYDCLASKGVVLITVEVPGKGPVSVATTHLNCRGASGAPPEQSDKAYGQQAAFLAQFLERERTPGAALVVAGDFNRGQRPLRTAILDKVMSDVAGGRGLSEALRTRMAAQAEGLGRSRDAIWIRHRARDMQFVIHGSRTRILPVGAEITFGTEADGSTLSDHMGFTIHYRVERAG